MEPVEGEQREGDAATSLRCPGPTVSLDLGPLLITCPRVFPGFLSRSYLRTAPVEEEHAVNAAATNLPNPDNLFTLMLERVLDRRLAQTCEKPEDLDHELILDLWVEKTNARLRCAGLMLCSLALAFSLRDSYSGAGLVVVALVAAIWIGIEKDLIFREALLRIGGTGISFPFLFFQDQIPWRRVRKVNVDSINKESTAVIVEILLTSTDSVQAICTNLTPEDLNLLLLHLYFRAPEVCFDSALRPKASRVNELESGSPRTPPIEWTRTDRGAVVDNRVGRLDMRLFESRSTRPRLMKVDAQKPALFFENDAATEARDRDGA